MSTVHLAAAAVAGKLGFNVVIEDWCDMKKWLVLGH